MNQEVIIVRGCLLYTSVNSGGGVATAGEEMSTYIRDFSKPVVVSSASINADVYKRQM